MSNLARPGYSIILESRCCCEGPLDFGDLTLVASGLYIKEIILDNLGGPHLISERV